MAATIDGLGDGPDTSSMNEQGGLDPSTQELERIENFDKIAFKSTEQHNRNVDEVNRQCARLTGSPELSIVQLGEANVDNIEDYGSAAVLELGVESRIAGQDFDKSNTPLDSAHNEVDSPRTNGGGSEPQAPLPFERSGSPTELHRHKMSYEKVSDIGFHKMHKFSLYETKTRYYVVGGEITDTSFRMLKIDRTASAGQLTISEDEIIYSKRDMKQLLNTIEDGNQAAGGMKLKASTWGILGFLKFTDAYYMLIITKRKQVAMIGGHSIFQIEGTELVSLTISPSSRNPSNDSPEEARFLNILSNLDLSRSFYFSYSYNIARTLQHNIIRERQKVPNYSPQFMEGDLNNMFVWNHHLLNPALKSLQNPCDWCMPIIHGYIDQSAIKVFSRNVYVTLIARRSKVFAGARFLKRGTNDLGYVANDVETEQIVSDMQVTSFGLDNPHFTSFVQHRGSIPLYWTQDNSGVSPKPNINLNLIDPFFATTALHLDNLFERYGAPICVVNLVKDREHEPREKKLGLEYKNAIDYLNQALPEGKRIEYYAYDMARAAKTRGYNVISRLEEIAETVVAKTGLFHNGTGRNESSVQNGISRTNCVDCLDRTNTAQFVIGKRALACQLQRLGVLVEASLNYDSDATRLFANMFNDHGDTLASQYGGSHLVNTTDSYRKINNWQSYSRDMLESFKRYYHNSFFDNQRQEAYNLFLGNYVFVKGQPMLWQLPNDYYLHHANPRTLANKSARNYYEWFTPAFLETKSLPPVESKYNQSRVATGIISLDQWWQEYYKPQSISSFSKLFDFRINSTKRYLPKLHSASADQSPFSVRKHNNGVGLADKKSATKEVRDVLSPIPPTFTAHHAANRISSLQQWLNPKIQDDMVSNKSAQGTLHDNTVVSHASKPFKEFALLDKSHMNQESASQFPTSSLYPTVTKEDVAIYEEYILQSLQQPSMQSETTLMARSTNREYLDYVNITSIQAKDETTDDERRRAGFEKWWRVNENPLTVTEEDLEKKRYQVYRKFVEGKSLFK